MTDFNPVQHVTDPTHVEGNLLNFILTNSNEVRVSDASIVDADVADITWYQVDWT